MTLALNSLKGGGDLSEWLYSVIIVEITRDDRDQGIKPAGYA